MSTSTKIRATAAALVSLLVALSLLGLSHRVAPPAGGGGGEVAPAAPVSSPQAPQAPTSPSVAADDQSWSAGSGDEDDGYESE